MNALFAPIWTRFTLRLALPALMLCGLAALGDPLPAPAEERFEQLSQTLVRQADTLIEKAEEQRDAMRGGAGQTATAMRLLMTMPAFTRRCITSCADS
ncbi:MAG: hypothetical protein R3F22_03395 [Lysobacteraceae bacterium]